MGKKVSLEGSIRLGPVPDTSAIVQVRGTSGSSKSTSMKHLISTLHHFEPVATVEVRGGREKVRAYSGYLWPAKRGRIVVLGDYSEGRTAGGCDTIPSIAEVAQLIEDYGTRPRTLLVLEGLLLAHSWGALGEHIHPRWGERYINLFLDTPVETCLSRVMSRREGRGDETSPERAAKVEKNVREDYYRVELCWSRVEARGGVRLKLPHERAPELLVNVARNTWSKYCDHCVI